MAKLESLGIYQDCDTTSVVVAAVLDWVLKTNDGKEYFVNLFGFDWEEGASDCKYRIADTNEEVPGRQIYFLKTAVVKGRFVPPLYIDEYRIEKEQCGDCGVSSHCTRKIIKKDGNQVNMCNYCLAHSSDKVLVDTSGGTKECECCTVNRCQHHPHFRVNF